MNRRIREVVLLVVLAAGLACAPRARSIGAAARAGLEAREAEFVAAMTARDADRMAALFADDGVVHVANMPPVRGQDAIRRLYGNVFRFMESSRLEPEGGWVAASGDMAYGFGRTSNVFRGQDGLVRFSGKYSLVWERPGGAGEWRVALYSVSNDAAEGSPVDDVGEAMLQW